MQKKVAIFGCAGQLGVELSREFRQRGYAVTGWERSHVDITSAPAVEEAITSVDPEIVVNAAAYNQVDVAENEPAAAFQVNGLAVRNVALACRQSGALLVHFSTDCVFDGAAQRPYTEDDTPHPLGNFIELMLRLAGEGKTIRVVQDHVASPTYAPALASRTADLVEKGARGVVHCGGGQPISWYDYAKLIFREAGLEPELKPTAEREYRTPARRPRYSALSNAKMESLGIEPMPPLDTAVRSYLQIRRRWRE
ncbi:MAG: SDR family oxidoreductase [Acidobacteria bacterium]|nr:SDR family oxidoreductase [Acidobacteriota bacterium]